MQLPPGKAGKTFPVLITKFSMVLNIQLHKMNKC